jgi:WD40 repeat protein/serine/threonine protein kinase
MTLSATCPACGLHWASIPAAYAGRVVRCSRCGKRFPVAAPPAATRFEEEPVARPRGPAKTQWDEVGVAAPAPTREEGEGPASAPTLGRDVRPATSVREWQVGDVVLDLYEVTGVLGQGGMGRVYRVRHRGWDVDLAVKTPLASALRAAGGAEAFEREAETWVGLGLHPHTVSCYYVRRVDGLPRVFAEFVDGGSLHDWIKQRRLTSVDRILDLAIQFAWGLHYAHEQGLVHCDVKPSNVMVTADGVAKVTDFGLARARSAAPAPVSAPHVSGGGSTLVVAGGAAGTPAYMSPEQSAGRALTRRTDLWSWALSVLEMFRGERSWEFGVAAGEVLRDYLDSGGKVLGQPAMPRSVADLLAQCFRDDPEERPHTLWDAAAALYGAYEEATSCAYERAEPQGGRETASSLSNRAVSLLDLGRSAEAAGLWERALRVEPSHLEATYNQTLHAWRRGQVADDEALRRVEEAARASAATGRAAHLVGQLLLGLGELARAARELNVAAEADGHTREHLRLAALGACALGDAATAEQWATAERRLEDALHARPDDATARAAYVLCLRRLGKAADAARAWDAAGAPAGVEPQSVLAPELPGFDRTAVLRGANASVRAVAAGEPVVLGSDRDSVRVWSTTGGAASALQGRELGVRALLVSADGRMALTGAEDGTLATWELAGGRLTRTVARVPGSVYVVVATGGGRIVAAGSDRAVRVLDSSGQVERTLTGHGGAVNCLAVSTDGRLVASGANDGSLLVWDLASGDVVARLSGHAGAIHAVAFVAGALVSGGDDRLVRIWDVATAGVVRALAGHTQPISGLVSRADGRVLSVGADRSLRLWNLGTGELGALVRLDAPVAAVASGPSVVWAASGLDVVGVRLPAQSRLPSYAIARPVSASEAESRNATFQGRLSAAQESLLKGDITGALELARTARTIPGFERAESAVLMWDELCTLLPRQGLQSAWESTAFEGHTDPVLAVAVSSDGRVLSGGMDQSVRLWDLAQRQALAVLKGHAEAVTGVAFTPDGRLGISGSWDKTAYVWDLAASRVVRPLEGHEEYVSGVAVSPDGTLVLTASWDSTVRVWDVATGRERRVMRGHDGHVSAVACGPDGRFAVSGAWDHSVRAWDVESGECVCRLEGHEDNVSAVAIAATGRQVASGGADHSVRVWDLRSRRAQRVLTGHSQEVTAVAFSPDGRFLVSGSRDKTVRLWDLTTGKVARTLDHTAAVLGLAFARAGATLVTAGADRVVRAWHLDWEPETRALPPWDEKAKPYLESYVSLRASTLRPGAAPAVSDGDVETLLQDLRRRGFGGLTRDTVVGKLRDLTERAEAPTFWDEVRKSAPRPSVLPGKARIPVKKVVLAAVAVVVIAGGLLPWVHVEPKPHQLPYMQARIRKLDTPLVPLPSPGEGCDDDYVRMLDAARTSRMSAPRMACLVRFPADQVVDDILSGLDLSDPDPFWVKRKTGNVVSLIAGLGAPALERLCSHLGDANADARAIAAALLARTGGSRAAECVIAASSSSEPFARVGAAAAWGRTLAAAAIQDERAWAVERRLLADPEPTVRISALGALALFNPDAAEKVLPPLLADGDPAVKAAAEGARGSAEGARRWIRLYGERLP